MKAKRGSRCTAPPLGHFTLEEKSPVPLNRKPVGPHRRSGRFKGDIHFLSVPGFKPEPSTLLPRHYTGYAIPGAFVTLRTATASFLRPARPSVHTEQICSHWADFHKIWYLKILRKSVEKNSVSLKSDKNNGYFTWIPVYICDISLNSS
jgi:hypothetical protein